jgi:cation diffusion facilitator family transporter
MIQRLRNWFGLENVGGAPQVHGHSHGHDHAHTHGVIDPSIVVTERGIWAIKWSFAILAITAILQIIIVIMTSSVALLADTIHNAADATTAIPLWIAFRWAHRKPTQSFTYGYGRVEDLAGVCVVLVILFSALVAAYESINRFLHPLPITLLGWVAVAGLIGFIGNELVAVLRIRVGRQMNSAALIADGYHARTDGLTSLAVVVGAFFVWMGFPLADPIVGLLITAAIFVIIWQSAKAVLTRMLDGIDPSIISEIRHGAEHVSGIEKVAEVKARWLGHRLQADVRIHLRDTVTLGEADRLGKRLKEEIRGHVPAMSDVNILFESIPSEPALFRDIRLGSSKLP